jgi:hypothetical protein
MNHYWTWQFNKGIHAFRMVETIAMVERRAASPRGYWEIIDISYVRKVRTFVARGARL